MDRTLNRVVLKVVAGVYQPDTGLTVELKTDEAVPILIGTTTESPAGSGQYYLPFTSVEKWGYWYAGGTRKTEWGQWWLGEEASPLFGSILNTQVAFGDSSGHITGSSDLTYASGVLSLLNSTASYVVFGTSRALPSISSISVGTKLLLADGGASAYDVAIGVADVTGGQEMWFTIPSNIFFSGWKWYAAGAEQASLSGTGKFNSKGYNWGSSSFSLNSGIIVTGTNRTTDSIYISDISEVTVPHGLLNVHRTGPVPYGGTDQLKAIAGSFNHNASVAPQPDTMTAIWGLLDLGMTAGTNYPNYAGGLTGTVSSHATGTIPLMIGVEGQVQHYDATATGTITFGASLYARAPRNMNGATGTFTYAYGLYVEDTALGTTERAAIRLQTEGRISWNNDLSLHRNGAGSLTLTGAFDISSNVEARGYMSLWGTTYIRGNGVVLNKAADNFLPFWTRDTTGSEVVYDLATVGNVMLTTGKYITNGFISGEFGSGYRLDNSVSVSGQSFMEIDNLVVRGSMRVNVFEKGVIKAVSGGIYLSSASSTIMFDHLLTGVGAYDSFIVKDNAFAENDTLQYKDLTITGGLVVVSAFFRAWTQAELDGYWGFPAVTQFEPDNGGYRVYGELVTGSGTLRAGGTIVQVANSTNTTRQAGLFLTANDGSSNVPYIDVYNGRTSYVTVVPKVRLGNLAGVRSPTFGTLVGYGLYGGNVYLDGNAQIAGTLTAGYNGLTGATFYAGKIGTNILTKPSETFGTWNDPGSSGITITDNNSTSPDGKTTGSRWVRSGGTNFYRYNTTTTQAGSNTFTFSIWARGASGGEVLGILIARWTDWATIANQDMVLTTSWQRYTLTGTADGTNPTNMVYVQLIQNTNSTTMYLWGAQLEVASQATAYQPVDGSATYAGTEQFGMWSIAGGFGGTIQNPKVSLDSSGMKVALSGSYYARLGVTPVSATKGFYIGDGTNHLVQFLDTGVNQIAYWDIGTTSISKVVGSKAMVFYADDGLAAHNPRITISGNTSGAQYITLGGSVYDGAFHDDKWGFVIRVNSLNLFRCYSAANGTGLVADFAGWSFDDTKIYKTNAVLSSTGYVSFGSTPPTAYGNNVGAWLGDVSGTAKMSLYSDANNYLKWDGSNLVAVGGTIGTGPTGTTRVELKASDTSLTFTYASGGSDVEALSAKPLYNGSHAWFWVDAVSAATRGIWVGPSSSASTGWGNSRMTPLGFRTIYLNNTTELARIGWNAGLTPGFFVSTAGVDTQVVGERRTGWGTNTGTKYRGNLSDASSQADVNRALFALLEDVTTHGLVGA